MASRAELKQFKKQLENVQRMQELPSGFEDVEDDQVEDFFFQQVQGTRPSSRQASRVHSQSAFREVEGVEKLPTGFSCVPTDDDPNLFAVRVRRGYAEELVKQVILKCIVARGNAGGADIGIYTAFTNDPSSEYIYVEALTKRHMTTGLAGLLNIYWSKIAIVPKGERRALLSSVVKRSEAQVGDYVRLKGGPYRGDLAQIVAVSKTGSTVTIKIQPRIDFSDSSGQNLEVPKFGQQKNKPIERKPQKWFNHHVVEGAYKLGHQKWLWNGKQFDEKGYLLLDVSTKSICFGNKMAKKTDSELQLFKQEDIITAEIHTSTTQRAAFNCGDKVKVSQGQLRGAIGVLIETRGDTQAVLRLEDRGHVVVVDFSLLIRYFPLNSHVTITGGRVGVKESGTVIYHSGKESVIVQSDNGTEFEVSVGDICLSSHYVPAAVTRQGGLSPQLREGDLIKAKPATGSIQNRLGIIVSRTLEYAMVLMSDGATVKLPLSDLISTVSRGSGIKSFRDRNGAIVHVRDTVKVEAAGMRSGMVATVKQIFNTTAFLEVADSLNKHYFVEEVDHLTAYQMRKPSEKANEKPNEKKNK